MSTAPQHAPAATGVSPSTDIEHRLLRVQRYLQVDPGNPHLLVEAVDLQLCLGALEAAEQLAVRAVSAHDEANRLRQRIAAVYLAHGRAGDAERHLGDAAGEGQPVGEVAFLLGWSAYLRRDYARAAALLGQETALTQSTPGAVRMLAHALHHCGELERAIALLAAMPELQLDADAAGLLSLLYLDRDALPEAAAWAGVAVGLRPSNLPGMVVLGYVALASGELDAARGRFAAALAVQPHDGRSWLGLGLVHLQQRQLPEAEDALQAAVRQMPAHPGTRLALGWCQLVAKRLPEARTTFEAALECNRNFAESHGARAVVDAMTGRREAARRGAQRALRLDPLCLSAKYAEAILDDQVGDDESLAEFARQMLEQVHLSRQPATRH